MRDGLVAGAARCAPRSQLAQRAGYALFVSAGPGSCSGLLSCHDVAAGVVLREPVSKAVIAPAVRAVDPRDERGVDEGLAGRVAALALVGEDVGFSRTCGDRLRGIPLAPPRRRPRALAGTLVRVLGAVLAAVLAPAGEAGEGEEVELVAIGGAAVGADGVEVGGWVSDGCCCHCGGVFGGCLLVIFLLLLLLFL